MINFLDTTIDKFKDYRNKLIDSDKENLYLKAITHEALEKLYQINFFYSKQQQAEYCFLKITMLYFLKKDGLLPSDYKCEFPRDIFDNELEYRLVTMNKTVKDLQREVISYAESIYYFAFTFKKRCDEIPGLKQFSPVGIRDVRNHIMEHPKHKFSNAFTIKDSIQLKTGKFVYSESDKKWTHNEVCIDAGLKKNMTEFKRDLENLLSIRIQDK